MLPIVGQRFARLRDVSVAREGDGQAGPVGSYRHVY